jgi:serine/threonine protein kinase
MLIVAGQAAVDGTPFGRYRLVELLGRGGMGEVWRAYDTAANNRTVAIKLLPPHLAGDNTFVQRFRREADAAGQLNNPHIIPIHNYGEIDGRLYVDMRLIEGRDLQEVLAGGPMEPARAVRIIEQVARALQAAHKIGLVHRDVKPSNILLDEDDFAYLIDFGIARAADQTRMTGTGNIIGSWHYMSPERLRDGQVDARSDIYALACVLYECLTGSAPYPGDNFEQQITAHLTEPPPRPSSTDPNMPVALDSVIATGMAKDPNQRYVTTIELAEAARDAITAPISLPKPIAPTQPATELAQVPAAPPTIEAQHPTTTPDSVKASAPIGRPPPQEMPAYRPQPSAEEAPPTPPSRPWWQRNAVVISAVLIVTVVATVVAVTLATTENHPASQTGQTGQSSLPDAATLLKQSAQTTRGLTSAHLVQTVTGKIQGFPLKTMTIDLTTSPSAAALGTELITVGGSDIQTDFVILDGEMYATLTPSKWSDFGKASDIYDPTTMLNPDTGLANLLATFTNPKAEGRETISGQSTIKISGNASADAVNNLVPAFSAMQPVPATVWMQETGDHQLVQVFLQKSPGSSFQMTLSNWGEQVQVTKPPVSS